MLREIGSEFHRMPLETGKGLPFPRKGTLVFSGRTAIEAVLRKIPKDRTALLPSYCCESMIVPFRKAGIDIKFFDVQCHDGLKADVKKTADILLWCNYFGFHNEMPDFDGLIIEDITHSLLSDEVFHPRSDYLVASIRKWEPIVSGGYCSVDYDGVEPPKDFVLKRQQAMEMKADYLCDLDEAKKPVYLSLYGECNSWLTNNYSGHAIDSCSKEFLEHADIESQRKIRRNNARALYDGLEGLVQFLFPKEEMDCPLFVPICIPDKRDVVRKRLAENQIYCPAHWPHPDAGCESNLYDMELSLCCDQRYTEDDMMRIISVLGSIIKTS